MLGAVMFGHRHYPAGDRGASSSSPRRPPRSRAISRSPTPRRSRRKCSASSKQDLRKAYAIPAKHERQDAVAAVKKKAMEHFFPDGKDNPERPMLLRRRRVQGARSQDRALEHPRHQQAHRRPRSRHRAPDRLSRPPFLPRTHGSALFTRGETQAIVVATLGTGEDEQWIDALQGPTKKRSCCTTTSRRSRSARPAAWARPGRREIGHGKLAWRAIRPMLPAKDEFPYTIRVVSEITESNGSSSMATVCGTSLALMDAGVPLKRPTAGIAMGLILEDKRYAVLSDILGDEDHLGDMDFKVAGTERGRHRAADGHQDRRHHRRDHEGGARPGQGRPPAHPRRDGEGARPRRAPSSANTRRASRPSRSRPTRSAK
mgnify:CR=1 FL=1